MSDISLQTEFIDYYERQVVPGPNRLGYGLAITFEGREVVGRISSLDFRCPIEEGIDGILRRAINAARERREEEKVRAREFLARG
jgi:hypothetical protein